MAGAESKQSFIAYLNNPDEDAAALAAGLKEAIGIGAQFDADVAAALDAKAVSIEKAGVATAKAAEASSSQGAAATSEQNAAQSEENALFDANRAVAAREGAEALYGDLASVLQAKNDSVAAAEASGPVVFYDTKALANSASASLPDQQVVEVFEDETKGNARTRYRKEGGALVFKLALPVVAIVPEMFGAISGGVVDATAAIAAAMMAAIAFKLPLDLGSKTYAVSTITPPANLVIKGDGAILKAVGTTGTNGIINLSNDNVVMEGAFYLDLNRVAYRGINAGACTGFKQIGYIEGYLPKQNGDNFNAVFMFNGSIDTRIQHLKARDYSKNDVTGIDILYGGVRAPNVNGFYFDTIECERGNQGANFNAGTRIRGERIIAKDISDNGIYIIGNCSDIRIGLLDVTGGEEACVLDSNLADANVVIDALVVRNGSKSVNLRMGGGYRIGMLDALNAPVQQSSDLVAYPGVTGLRIDQARIVSTTNSRPVTLEQDTNISFGSLHIVAMALDAADSPIRLNGAWDKVSIETLTVITTPASNNRCIKLGPNAGVIPAPNLDIGRIVRFGPVDVLDSNLVAAANIVNCRFYDTAMGSFNEKLGSFVRTGTAEMELRSVNTTETLADIIARLSVWSGDTSIANPNLRRVFSMLVRAANAAGNLHETDFLDDLGAVIATVYRGGMSIKPPTSPVSIPVGGLWNNNGVPGIRGPVFGVDPGFDDPASWTAAADWTVGSSKAVKVAGASARLLSQPALLVPGRTYLVTWDVLAGNAGTQTVQLVGGTTVAAGSVSGTGSKSALVTAVTGNTSFGLLAGSSTAIEIDNLNVAAV